MAWEALERVRLGGAPGDAPGRRPRWVRGSTAHPLHVDTLDSPSTVTVARCVVLAGRTLVVTGDRSGRVAIRDLASREHVGSIDGDGTEIAEFGVLVVDGRSAIVVCDGRGRVRPVEIGDGGARYGGDVGRPPLAGGISAAAFVTVDGRPHVVTVVRDASVSIRDVETGAETFLGDDDLICALDAITAPDGRTLVVTADLVEGVRVWNPRDGTSIAHDPDLDDVTSIHCAVIEGRPVALIGRHDGTVDVRDLDDGRTTTVHHGDGFKARTTSVDVRGRTIAVVTAGDDAHVLDVGRRERLGVLTGHTGAIETVACAMVDGAPVAVTGARDDTVRVWTLAPLLDRPLAVRVPRRGHSDDVTAVAVSTSEAGTLVVTSSYHELRVWDPVDGGTVRTPHETARDLGSVSCATVDGRPVAVMVDRGAIRMVDLSGDVLVDLGEFDGTGGSATTSSVGTVNGRTVVVGGGRDGTVRIWDAVTRTSSRTFAHGATVVATAVTEVDGRPIVFGAGDDGDVHTWDHASGERLSTLSGLYDVAAIVCAAIDDRPVAVTASERHEAHVWDLGTSRRIVDLTGHSDGLTACDAAVIDGRLVAATASRDGTVRVWDVSNGRCDAVLPMPHPPQAVALLPDGALVVGAGREVVVVDPPARR